MSKIFLIVVILLVVVGIWTGVFEVKVHTDKLSGVPAVIGQTFKSGDVLSQAGYYLTTWKRSAEVTIANSDDKKFELYVKYVEQDTKNLKEALDGSKSPATILMRSKLLNESLDEAKKRVEGISEEALHKIRDTWLKALAAANAELERLPALADEYKKYQEQIQKIAPSVKPSPAIDLKF